MALATSGRDVHHITTHLAVALGVGRGIRTDRNALIALWKRQQAQGVSHVALNLKPLRRPAAEVLAELAEYVLPEFPVGTVGAARPSIQEAQP
ncbi:hypothetical protein [Serratia ficaria]|uniref:hypothetical protein n=1 Tax=Serratia ficaria TaxID=61651 RepID=UPI002177B7BE|nr:hypothetical protein [Serratia ficaria]CAI1220710.1 luciferase-type oxidoreductase, BA3436 family [Serratia ficaria]CAI1251114.1 luciferase-type oxidoreductase, BA3436 family [Serratia ficaria]CAI1986255.1 luciferase-type oxidoreductase, BA3436 family [Serratia ficaria]CAI2526951.1 luciferase-type oxidoreductase, BA3436 family [Serratia ficaria]CAI2531249.1 luciferase-type oxidoreductase, BA3436 family [Serratia ficaria]